LQEKEKSYTLVLNGLRSSPFIHSLHLSPSTFCFYLSLNFREKIKREKELTLKKDREREIKYQERNRNKK
jgi:hypothetical protein